MRAVCVQVPVSHGGSQQKEPGGGLEHRRKVFLKNTVTAIRRKVSVPIEPVLLGNLYAVVRLENQLHEEGIPWKSVCEDFHPDTPHEDLDYVAPFRRWLLFVRPEDLERAIEITGKTFRPIGRESAVPFEGGRLCERHGYEIEPCTHCSTGWDWLAKSDEAESEATRPPRFAGGL